MTDWMFVFFVWPERESRGYIIFTLLCIHACVLCVCVCMRERLRRRKLGHTHTRESARGGAGGDDVQFFNRTAQKKEKKKVLLLLCMWAFDPPFKRAPSLELYTYTLGCSSLRRGEIYKREKNSIIIKKGVSLSLSAVFMNGRRVVERRGERKKKGAPEEEVVWGLVHSFLLPSIRLASSSG